MTPTNTKQQKHSLPTEEGVLFMTNPSTQLCQFVFYTVLLHSVWECFPRLLPLFRQPSSTIPSKLIAVIFTALAERSTCRKHPLTLDSQHAPVSTI